MPAPTYMSDLSTTASSNYPAGSDTPSSLDDSVRALSAVVKANVTKGSDITSASSITIPAAGNYFVVTGTTTINTIADTNSWTGREVVLKFSSALTINHSSGLILPGAANMSISAGDVVRFVFESTGVWRCTSNASGVVSGDLYLQSSTYAAQPGSIYKGGTRFLHDFTYGNNGTVTPTGFNTFIGKNSGNFTMGSTATSNQESSWNVGVGDWTLNGLTLGAQNSAFGVFALQRIATGLRNVAIGTSCGAQLTSGVDNVIIGQQAGYQDSPGNLLTSADQSVLIGGSCRPSAVGNANEVVIGYDARGNGSNTITLGSSTMGRTYLSGKQLTYKSGGTVTQTGSRTTAVTLDKVAGEITLVSAAATTAWQSFTVNNSTVSATDVILVNQKSGADVYAIHVTKVQAGSFRVSFSTVSGTTTEQPVFSFVVLGGASS